MSSSERQIIKQRILPREKVRWQVYEGDQIVARGENKGHTFTQLGKNRIAQFLAGMISDPADDLLDAYRVLAESPANTFYSDADVVSFWTESGTITTETETFDTAGHYYSITGWQSSEAWQSYYHVLSPDVTISAGQTVKFFIEYEFTGLGASADSEEYPDRIDGDKICAALLFNHSGGTGGPYNTSVRWLDLEINDGAINQSKFISWKNVNDNVVLISGHQWTIANNQRINAVRIMQSRLYIASKPSIIHQWASSGDSQDNTIANGPFYLINTTGGTITVQTDFEFQIG